MGLLKEKTMEIELIDRKLIVTPDTLEELTEIYGLLAAFTAYRAVVSPVSGEPLRCTEDGTGESGLPRQPQDRPPERHGR